MTVKLNLKMRNNEWEFHCWFWQNKHSAL
jgi:hypothetical protein